MTSRKARIFLISFMFPALAQANEVIVNWLVYPDSFTIVEKNSLTSVGLTKNSQPALNTTLSLLQENTNYYQLTTSTKTPTDNDQLILLEKAGKIQKLSSYSIDHVYDGRTGGVVTDVSLPTIYNKVEPFKIVFATDIVKEIK